MFDVEMQSIGAAKPAQASLIKEIDYGTPIRIAEKQVTLTIDGVAVSVPEGTSVMAAAMSLGTKIPKLCATDSIEPFRLVPPVPH